MYGFYLVLFLTTALFEEIICGVSISFCAPTITDLFPFPGNCTRFISCNRGQTTIFSCTHDSTFNSEFNRCDYEQRIDNCQNSIGNLKDLQISCPTGSSSSFPHPFDCKKFIACSHGLTYTMNCSSGTVYNSLISVCDWRYNVPGCFGNLGNGVTLRGDVTLSSINLEIGSMNFESKKYVGNEYLTNQTIEFSTEKPKNDEDEDLDIDIRVNKNELDDRPISKITRNGRAGTALSFDQVLAINNLAESKKMSNNTGNEIENMQKQNVSHELYNSYPSANKLNKDEDHVGSSSELHARIVNSPNNWFNGKPLEPINNYINESRITEQVDDSKLVIFKSEIESVSTTTSETLSTKIIVENSPSINLLNYNYINDYDHGSVQIDQDYSKIRNHTVSFTVNNNHVRKDKSIQKLNYKSTGLKKLFNDNSTDGISFSTLFVTPFKSEGDNQHVEVINQFSGQVLRLTGGSSAHRGYVEIRGIGFIGQCNNSWNLSNAHKICKKLGYKRGAKITWKSQTNLAELPLLSLESNIFCQNDKSEFQICTFKNTSKCSTERDTIGVECFLDSPAYCNKNEVPFHRNCYHLVNSSLELNHEDAIQYCSLINSSLLYITAQDENDFISEWLTQKYPQVNSIMTAGIGFTTMARTIWVWQDSEKSFFNFMKWWPGWRNEKILPPSAKSSASCIVMKNKFPCYDQPNLNCKTDGYFFWDVEDCTSSMKGNHYICKRPYNNIL